MSSDRRREEILRDVAAGELSIDSREVQELVQEDPSVATEIEEMERASTVLEAGVEFERQVRREATSAFSPEEVEATLRTLREARSGRSAAAAESRAAPRRWPRAVAAVAALLAVSSLLYVALVDPEPNRTHDPRTLGDGIENLTPQGEIRAYSAFSWTFEKQDGVHYRVEVFDPAPGAGAEPIDKSPTLTRADWSPTPDQTRQWPRSILWTVTAYDATGARIDSASAACSLSP